MGWKRIAFGDDAMARNLPGAVRDAFETAFRAAGLPGNAALFNELAYDPPGEGKGKEPYLFYLPWANHNTNSSISSQDGLGPLRRGLLLASCSQLDAIKRLFGASEDGDVNDPTSKTLLDLLALRDPSTCDVEQ